MPIPSICFDSNPPPSRAMVVAGNRVGPEHRTVDQAGEAHRTVVMQMLLMGPAEVDKYFGNRSRCGGARTRAMPPTVLSLTNTKPESGCVEIGARHRATALRSVRWTDGRCGWAWTTEAYLQRISGGNRQRTTTPCRLLLSYPNGDVIRGARLLFPPWAATFAFETCAMFELTRKIRSHGEENCYKYPRRRSHRLRRMQREGRSRGVCAILASQIYSLPFPFPSTSHSSRSGIERWNFYMLFCVRACVGSHVHVHACVCFDFLFWFLILFIFIYFFGGIVCFHCDRVLSSF